MYVCYPTLSSFSYQLGTLTSSAEAQIHDEVTGFPDNWGKDNWGESGTTTIHHSIHDRRDIAPIHPTWYPQLSALLKSAVHEFHPLSLPSQNSRDIFFSPNGNRTCTAVLSSAQLSMQLLSFWYSCCEDSFIVSNPAEEHNFNLLLKKWTNCTH